MRPKTCGECEHCEPGKSSYCCYGPANYTHRVVPKSVPPDWCPLPTEPEPKRTETFEARAWKKDSQFMTERYRPFPILCTDEEVAHAENWVKVRVTVEEIE